MLSVGLAGASFCVACDLLPSAEKTRFVWDGRLSELIPQVFAKGIPPFVLRFWFVIIVEAILDELKDLCPPYACNSLFF